MTGWHTRIQGNMYRLTGTGKLIRHTEEYMTEAETQALHLALAALDERLQQLAEAAEKTGRRITRLEGKTKAMHARFEQHRKDMIDQIISTELHALALRRAEQHAKEQPR
ncbi:hypothetical protein [Brachybacterium massiliense]|uniref:hypothetical protein n=1 Tax=Brachybacterium massiliense TaxID=1755098 RepID=UPI0011212B8F|nr:hypothetical protein [Brachybacterium massiliense]